MKRHLIIGGGIAGTAAAEELRKLDPEAEITLFSEEQHPLYSRVLLPHFVKKKIPRERVFIKSEAWYQEKTIDWQRGVRVEKIDHANRFVETSEGREIPFDTLLVTTGGDVNLLGEDIRGVSYFRTLDDADHVKGLISEVGTLPESERRGVVYGGGFISLEYINMFHHYGMSVTVLMRSDGFWSKVLSDESKQVLRRKVEDAGMRVITGEPLPAVVGEKELTGVKLQNGEEIPARILGVGIGIHTEAKILKDAGIEVDTGVVANEYLETSLEGVFTAGDVAEFDDVSVGRRMRAGNWMSAVLQGRTVAKTMHGERTKFELVSSYTTNLLGMQIVAVGDTDRASADEVRQIQLTDDSAVEVYDRGGVTVGGFLIGDVSKRAAITAAIKGKLLYSVDNA